MTSRGITSLIGKSLHFDWMFVIKNFFVWLCFCATLTILNLMTHNRDVSHEIASDAVLLVCGLIGTYLLRIIILSAGENVPWKSIYIHAFLIGLPIASFLMAVLTIELHSIFMSSDWPERHYSLIQGLFGVWFFMALLFGGWTGVYVSAMAVQRSNKSDVERLETETALREAELRALKAQINPHFLFNSLNTIRALVNEHPERAQEAVLHLSLMLRASLQSETALRSLRDEIETTNHYLELEKMRFEERLGISIDISPEAQDVLIPPMIVQTLVENAIKHGIGTIVGGGLLQIEGHVEKDRLVVRISNPGNLKTKIGGIGLGLKNAKMRLQRMVGEDAHLDISENAGIVTARLDLPIKRDDKSIIG